MEEFGAWYFDLARRFDGRVRTGFSLLTLFLNVIVDMAGSLYAVLEDCMERPPPVRVYAPVGSHDELLPYLVRRLLENGANSSFINQLSDAGLELDQLVENPCERVQALHCQPHSHIPLPRDLYGAERRNAFGAARLCPGQQVLELAHLVAAIQRVRRFVVFDVNVERTR